MLFVVSEKLMEKHCNKKKYTINFFFASKIYNPEPSVQKRNRASDFNN